MVIRPIEDLKWYCTFFDELCLMEGSPSAPLRMKGKGKGKKGKGFGIDY